MITQSEFRINSLSRFFSRGESLAVVFVGCSDILGWIFGITGLKNLLSGAVTTKANTAVGFVLAGGSLWVALTGLTDRLIHRVKQACAVMADLRDPPEVIARAQALSFKAPRGTEDIYELNYICKHGGSFPAASCEANIAKLARYLDLLAAIEALLARGMRNAP